MANVSRTIIKSFVNYSSESEKELKELSKVNLIASSGRTTERKVFITISKPKAIEVIIYDLSNFSNTTYHDFNRKIKKLVR